MPSVVGLLEQHGLAARRRVDGLREEADRIRAELATAEQEWQESTVARRRVDAVLGAGSVDTKVDSDSADAEMPSPTGKAGKPRSQVPVWCEGLAQRIVQVLADRSWLHQGPLSCQEMAATFGMDVVPALVEGLRAKAKRLVARGRPAEPGPGRFTLAAGVAGISAGS